MTRPRFLRCYEVKPLASMLADRRLDYQAIEKDAALLRWCVLCVLLLSGCGLGLWVCWGDAR